MIGRRRFIKNGGALATAFLSLQGVVKRQTLSAAHRHQVKDTDRSKRSKQDFGPPCWLHTQGHLNPWRRDERRTRRSG